MSWVGKSKTLLFVLSLKDQQQFLSAIKSEHIVLFENERYDLPDVTSIVQTHYAIAKPSGAIFYLFNKTINPPKIDADWYDMLNKYRLNCSRSKIISVRPSRQLNDQIDLGHMGVFTSYYGDDGVEHKHPEGLVAWWKSIEKEIKKFAVAICVPLEALPGGAWGKKKIQTVYVGPDALKLYEDGMVISDFLNSPVTYHPKDTKYESARQHDSQYLKKIAKIMKK